MDHNLKDQKLALMHNVVKNIYSLLCLHAFSRVLGFIKTKTSLGFIIKRKKAQSDWFTDGFYYKNCLKIGRAHV